MVDVQLRMTTQQLFLCVFQLLAILAALLASSYWLALLLAPLARCYLAAAQRYRSPSRDLQRLDSASRAPIFSACAEALAGAATLRAFGAAERFHALNAQRLDHNVRACFVSAAANRWLAVRLEALGQLVVASTAALAVGGYLTHPAQGPAPAGLAGLSLSFALGLPDFLTWLVRVFTMMESQMGNAGRLAAWARLPPEERAAAPRVTPPREWPAAGAITFDRVTMSYRADLRNVLTDFTLHIAAAEKVGFVGRSGAGKSSVLVCLFRMVELRAGTVAIDGLDISHMELQTLRRRLSIIPQEPVLFSGTLRSNLDPEAEHADSSLIAALAQASLSELVHAHPDGLQRSVEKSGANLTAPQRQLLCAARALLKRSRVLVLDEGSPTANTAPRPLDRPLVPQTDELVALTVARHLADSTVLTIAHRLPSVLQCDRVVVMGGGAVLEAGPPAELRATPGSKFAELWAHREAEAESRG